MADNLCARDARESFTAEGKRYLSMQVSDRDNIRLLV
jgi:hypothetical protein